MPAAAADALITTSVAPFPCAASHGGVYVDTTCAQVCVCVTADAKWARSDTGVEGSATDCCLPATTTLPITTTSSTTTTTTTTTSTTTTLIVIPTAGLSDANCPATIPVQNGTQNGTNGYANQNQTCATGGNATGYDVSAVTLYIGAATAGKKVKCSVYDSAGPPRNHVAAGCDTVEAVLAANPTGYVTMATTGSCHLASATRYWIACTSDDAVTAYGKQTASCTGCWAWVSTVYANAWPATLSTGGSYNVTITAYLQATATP